MYFAYLQGRAEKDPSEGWYGGEIWFYDNYVIPLAGKLRECGVFGVSSDEYLNYAQQNRFEWERKGHDIIAGMKAKAVKDAKKMGILIEMETVVEDEGSDAAEDSKGPNVSSVKVADSSVQIANTSVQIADSDSAVDDDGRVVPSSDAALEPPALAVADSTPSVPIKGRLVNVPAGRLGITIDTAKGSPIIYSVDSDSPVAGMLKPGDVILAIDDIDTASMVATEIAELIAAKAAHERRFIVQKSSLLRRFSLK
jgi:PDZ domain